MPIRPVLAAIQEKVAAGTAVTYAKGCEVTGADRSGFAQAVAAAEQADVALVFVGGKSGLTNDCTWGESRDRAEINLTGVQEALVQAVAATGKPVVVVLVNGRPLSVNWIAQNIPAILEAWLPGEEGAEAIADVLFGDVNPGGKLPITFPRDVGQIPIYYNHKVSGGRSHWQGDYVNLSSKPLWPFGFGLSYTSFKLDNLQQDKMAVTAGDTIEISCTLTNCGPRDGEEVVQLYINDPLASVTRRVKELKGFKRVALAVGRVAPGDVCPAGERPGFLQPGFVQGGRAGRNPLYDWHVVGGDGVRRPFPHHRPHHRRQPEPRLLQRGHR